MTLRQSFRPLRPDLDRFLFAQVGNEAAGVPLSVISALTRLGLDPWEEAGRLSSLSEREAAEQLARLITDLPSHTDHLRDARDIAAGLIPLLPERGSNATRSPQTQIRSRFWPRSFPKPSQFWVACVVLTAAVLLSAVMHHGFPFGIGGL
ncbi:MAG: hypothetical protein WB697_12670 [Stellaceae bacterium]